MSLGARIAGAVRAAGSHRAARHLPFVVLTAAFVSSRLYYRAHFGLTFDAEPLSYFLQYMPMWLPKNDFWRSLLYLHQQPPLQNLLAGGIYRLVGPERAFGVLEGIYTAMGFALAQSLLASLRRLGASAWLSTIAVSMFTASPVAVLYETWLFYHQPVATLLTLALFALLRFYDTGSLLAGLAFFAALGTVAEFRSVYGPLWMIVIAAGLASFPPVRFPQRTNPDGANGERFVRFRQFALGSPRRIVISAALLPILAVTAANLRTVVLIGESMGSALARSNVPLKIWRFLPESERGRLRAERLVSDEVMLEPFPPVTELPRLRLPTPPTGVPLLDLQTMPDGQANVHTLEYVHMVDKYYKADALYLLRHYPAAYLRSVGFGLGEWYCSSPTRDVVLSRSENLKKVQRDENVIEKCALGHPSRQLVGLQIGIPLCLFYALYRMVRARGRRASERSAVATVFFMTTTASAPHSSRSATSVAIASTSIHSI